MDLAPSYETLYSDYWDGKLSCSKLAKKHNVHVNTIKKWIKDYKMPTRGKSESAKLWMATERKRKVVVKKERPMYKDYETLFNHYWKENLCMSEIADLYGIKTATVQYWLDILKITRRSISESKKGKKTKYVYTVNKIAVRCAWCDKVFDMWPYRVRSTKFFYCSKDCRRQHWSKTHVGENSFNWKGGQWTRNCRVRESRQYIIARKNIKARDNWTCQLCGSKKNIVAHHIITVKKDPTKIYDENNLISLCDDCHRHKLYMHEEEYEQVLTDIVAKTVNCWNPLRDTTQQHG